LVEFTSDAGFGFWLRGRFGVFTAVGPHGLDVLLLALLVQQSVLNQSPESAYFAQTLQTWEQGRFVRSHGLVQWLGWLWPYAVLMLALVRLSRERGAQT
jgi:hypothetical protein